MPRRLLPLAALIVCVFRVVIGVRTYGVFSPARGEYIDLVAQAALPVTGQQPYVAFDIGTGSVVLYQIDSVGNPVKTRRLRDWTSAVLGDPTSGVGPSLETTWDASQLNITGLTRRGDQLFGEIQEQWLVLGEPGALRAELLLHEVPRPGEHDLGLIRRLSGDKTAEQAAADHDLRLVVVKLREAKNGFVLLPRRWVVERSFGWAARFRRLAGDYERLPETWSDCTTWPSLA